MVPPLQPTVYFSRESEDLDYLDFQLKADLKRMILKRAKASIKPDSDRQKRTMRKSRLASTKK